YRVNANGASDIDMGDEPPFLALPSGNLTAIPGLTVTSSGTLTNATTPNVFTNLPEGIPGEVFQSVLGTPNTAGSTMNWAFEVPNGTYEVRMYWGEHNASIDLAGERVFDVLLEGNLVYDDFDMLVEAGGQNIAIAESQIVEVTDGELNFDIEAVVSVGIIRGIEILEVEDTDAEAPSVAITSPPNYGTVSAPVT